MNTIFERIIEYFTSFVSEHSFFISWDYYGGLFSKYFSFIGFIVGFVFVILVYFSNTDTERKILGAIKVLLIVSLINTCYTILNFFDVGVISEEPYYYYGFSCILSVADILLAGFVLTIVVKSCYSLNHGRAFLLGLTTFAATPMLNFTFFGQIPPEIMIFIVVRALLAGLLCLVISFRRYFYTSWIWYFGFHMFTRISMLVMDIVINKTGINNIIGTTIDYLSKFIGDYILFAIILAFAIVFEKAIIPIKSSNATA